MDQNGANNKPVVKNEVGKGKTEWKQWAVLGAVVAVIAVGGYFLGNGTVKAPAESSDDNAANAEGEGEDTNGPAPRFAWTFTPAGGDGMTGSPFTKVTLNAGSEVKELGTYPGSCSIVASTDAWTPLPGELTGVICSWDGDGTELGVFFESGTYVIKKGVLTEGAEGEPSTRDGFVIIETL